MRAIGFAERFGYTQALQRLTLALLARLRLDLEAKLLRLAIEVDPLEHVLDSFTTDLGDELVRILIVETIVVLANLIEDVEVLFLRQQLLLLDSKVGRTAGLDNHVVLVVDDLFEILRLDARGGDRSCSAAS